MDFDAEMVTRAASAAADIDAIGRLARQVGYQPSELVMLAEGAARSVEERHGLGVAVTCGASAFLHGLLVGRRLTPAGPQPTRCLAEAVDAVIARGRHAVIADHCDLAGVAEAARDCAIGLPAVHAAPADARAEIGYEILFERGLALSLALFAA